MFTVIWRDAALDELADVYVLADEASRTRLEQVVVGWNNQLNSTPMNLGESRTGNRRIALAGRCGIIFAVDAAVQVVRVLHFWTY